MVMAGEVPSGVGILAFTLGQVDDCAYQSGKILTPGGASSFPVRAWTGP